jgi:hypothetical protein
MYIQANSMSPRWMAGVLVALLAIPASTSGSGLSLPIKEKAAMSLTLSSAAFQPKGVIPVRHACDGPDRSPPLAWTGVPANAKSLVLILDDPDAPDPAAPKMTWVHWLLYNLPPETPGLPEGVAIHALPAGTRQGVNDWQRTGYGGPCPPIGKHRYFHKLYALDILLPDLKQPAKAALEKAMQGHILAHAELVGVYQRPR